MKKRLADRIYSDLEADIVNGIYPVDTKLPPERVLAEKYDASRFAIREAIAMLIKSGFAETRPQSGTYVKNFYEETSLDSLMKVIKASNSIDIRTFRSATQYRYVNDVPNAGYAAENITQESLDRIEALILKKKMSDDPFVLSECDFQIYLEIIKISHDVINLAVTISLRPLRVMISEYLYSLGDFKDITIENDLKLFKALSRGSKQEAVKVMKERIVIIEDIMLKKAHIENDILYFPPIEDE